MELSRAPQKSGRDLSAVHASLTAPPEAFELPRLLAAALAAVELLLARRALARRAAARGRARAIAIAWQLR